MNTQLAAGNLDSLFDELGLTSALQPFSTREK